MDIVDILALTDTNIRQKTLPSSITKTNDAQIRDAQTEEIRVRGIIQAASTGELDEHSHLNTLMVLVWDVGVFVATQTPASPDNDITFASFDSGWLWTKRLDTSGASGKDTKTITGTDTYVLADGFLIDKIMFKPINADTVKIGLTAGGEEIMYQETVTAGVWRVISIDIVAFGSTKTIYFTGFTGTTNIIIYKRKL